LFLIAATFEARAADAVAVPQASLDSKAHFEHSKTSVRWIDFTLVAGDTLIIPGKINGRDAVVKLANSCGAGAIDTDFATSIGIEPKAGDASDAVITGLTVEIGGVTLRDARAQLLSLPVPKTYGEFILCDDLFNNVIVDIDFEKHRIAFRDPARFVKPTGAAMKLTHASEIRTVPISIEGAAPIQAEFFLGNPQPIAVYQTYYETHKILENRPSSARQGPGDPPPLEPEATLRQVRFAGVDLSQVPALFWTDTLREVSSPLASCNIGVELLSRFHLIVDYPHNRLFATPYPSTSQAPFHKDLLGLVLTRKDGNILVNFTSPGSPAAAAGIKAGDTITRIEILPTGKEPTQLWPGSGSVTAALMAASAGTAVTFTAPDGSTRKVRLSNFY